MIYKRTRYCANLLLIVALQMALFQYAEGQINSVKYPRVGDTILDHEFTDYVNFPDNKTKISDFRGKWLIVDFWSFYCGGCIASFPKMDRLQKKFGDQVQLLMVAAYANRGVEKTRDTYKKTRDIYNRMKAIHNLQFSVAFDSLALEKYALTALPTILVVNPEGIIIAKTRSVNEDQISELLQGKLPDFKRQFSTGEKLNFDRRLPLLTNGIAANGGVDTAFLFRSLLKEHNGNIPIQYRDLNTPNNMALKSGKLEVCGVSLRNLLLLAYFGSLSWSMHDRLYEKYSRDIVVLTSDSSDFTIKNAAEALYDYSLIVPREKVTKNMLQQIMRADLCNYFNISIGIEKRELPAYHLVVTDSQKAQQLRSKDGKPFLGTKNTYLDYTVVNHKIVDFILIFSKALSADEKRFVPLIDKTEIDYNVDMTIQADMMYMDSVNEALEKYGLRLIKSFEEMEIIVVRDR